MKTRNQPLLSVVLALLGMTGAFMTAVGFTAVKTSQDTSIRRGLDYEHFLAALDELIADAGDSVLVRFEATEGLLSDGRRVTYDTLVIEADPSDYPSFRRAGFLSDQVQTYNRFQRERAALGRVDSEWFDRLEPFNPSIFRQYRRGDGSKGLTRSAAAWSLRVRSPLEDEWKGEIQARDLHRGSGLLGSRVAISLRRPTRLVQRVNGRRQLCEFTPHTLEIRAYCLSEQRIPQAIFRLASDEATPNTAVAGWADLWVDGSRVSPGDSIPIRTGTVLQIDPLEPMVLGEYWEGILSSKQWINGRSRRVGAFTPPLDMFATLGRQPGPPGELGNSSSPIELSVDARASETLTRLLQDFADSELRVPLDFGVVVVGRIPDGQILAIAEIGDRRSRNRSNLLEPLPPGSAVKPLLAAAILSERPELASLRIPARSGSVTRVLGLPAVSSRRAFRSSLNCESPRSGWIDLRYFLRCSNNEYGASLVTASLWDSDAWRATGSETARNARTAFSVDGRRYTGIETGPRLRGGVVSRSTLLLSPLSEGLKNLFDLPTDPVIADATRRSRRVWQGLTFSDGRAVEVPYELLPAESRPALLSSGASEGTPLSLIYRYAYGAWENRWTLLDLTTSFGRVVTDRRMQLRFSTGTPQGQAPWEESLGLADHSWYGDFLGGLRDVPRSGTGRGLQTAWRRAGLPPALFAKTGTLTEPGQPGADDDLFIKSLLFAVGEESSGAGRPLECGIVGGIYLRFAEGPRRGSLPSYQLEFARERLGDFLKQHWEGFGVCEG